jgi:hypothetical protein
VHSGGSNQSACLPGSAPSSAAGPPPSRTASAPARTCRAEGQAPQPPPWAGHPPRAVGSRRADTPRACPRTWRRSAARRGHSDGDRVLERQLARAGADCLRRVVALAVEPAREAPLVEGTVPHGHSRDRPPSEPRHERATLAPRLTQLRRHDVHGERNAPVRGKLPHLASLEEPAFEGLRDLVRAHNRMLPGDHAGGLLGSATQ